MKSNQIELDSADKMWKSKMGCYQISTVQSVKEIWAVHLGPILLVDEGIQLCWVTI